MARRRGINLSEKTLLDYEVYKQSEKLKGNQPKPLSQIVRECLDEWFKNRGM